MGLSVVRPIRLDDLDTLLELARGAGAGFTSLPPDRDYLRGRIELSLRSFAAADVQQAGHERYLFVLEDAAGGAVGGCCAVEAACGLDEPFYNYRLGLTVHASRKFEVYTRVPTLYLTNDYTGASVLCSLYLRPEFRARGAGHLLSKCRLLFMAAFPQRFATRVIAEMRGVSDEQGRSPFWEGLGRHFFSVDYAEAERIVGLGNKSFIAELMPAHPIYSLLLPREAREAMGKVHAQTEGALHLLQAEGFRHQGYVDIFDGGPTVEAARADIRSIRESQVLAVRVADATDAGTPHLVCNARLEDFRCTLANLVPARDHLTLDRTTAAVLNMSDLDSARVVAL